MRSRSADPSGLYPTTSHPWMPDRWRGRNDRLERRAGTGDALETGGAGSGALGDIGRVRAQRDVYGRSAPLSTLHWDRGRSVDRSGRRGSRLADRTSGQGGLPRRAGRRPVTASGSGRERVLCTICARGGSKGVPKKNIRPLCGKPLIAHTIETALRCKALDRVVVSTDDPEIRDVALEYGAEAPFLRSAELATDQASKWPVLRHLVRTLVDQEGYRCDIVADLDPTA